LASFEAEFQRCVHAKEKGPIIGQPRTISGIDVNVFSRIRAAIWCGWGRRRERGLVSLSIRVYCVARLIADSSGYAGVLNPLAN